MEESNTKRRRSPRKRATTENSTSSSVKKEESQVKKRKNSCADSVACEDGKVRCFWARGNVLMREYHDNMWGVPCHDDRVLFEFLTLEGAQAGLSWLTVLKKAENYREAFDQFDIEKVAQYDEEKIGELCANAGLIRHPGKLRSAVNNAKLVLDIQKEFGSFDRFLWDCVDGKPLQTRCTRASIPSKTPLAETLSKTLKKRGFKFVGPTIMYAFMQAVGMVNDHTLNCFLHKELDPDYHNSRH